LIYVDTALSLQEAVRRVTVSEWVSLDTEADSLHHYVEKLCLAQISVAEEDFVIDPLVPLDLAPLVAALNEKPLILHGADFDIRILKRFYPFKPSRIFDTMIAAQILGYEKQSLADLVERHCGIVLSKKAQKADWSRRPLENELLLYAANDTRYLWRVWRKMRDELVSLGRLGWHEESCSKLLRILEPGEIKKDSGREPWQVKGWKQLKPRALAILKCLWEWREEQARRSDRPSFKIIHSETIVMIAQWAAENPGQDVALLPNASRNVKGEHRETLNKILHQAREMPTPKLTFSKPGPRGARLDAGAQKRLEVLKKEREAIASGLGIQPGILATNATLERLAAEKPQTAAQIRDLGCFMNWQQELLAESVLKASAA
jgi:ribonuclease D